LLVLVDADLIAYRCSATAEHDPEEYIPLSRVDVLFEQILSETKATDFKAFITGPNNFRREIYPAYKANRKQPKPKWLAACERYLIEEWRATVTDGCEADDYLGVELTNSPDAVVASIDKDLLQVPGNHYNFVRKERIYVEAARGLRTFYEQLLIGDATDNVKGCPGIGKAKAPRILEGCETESDMFDCVRNCYNDDAAMLLNGQLLWIWRTIGGTWNPLQLKQEAGQ
jgi:5'-3' exonuclease